MKKVLLFAGILVLFTAASCKKDFTCSCSYGNGDTPTEYKYTEVKKRDAKSACAEANTNWAQVGGSCELK